ncbi:MAG: PadR family transcriptional regulator [Gemmatimonadota bacterium]
MTPIAFDVLLCLLGGEAHGYAIMQAVRERSPGRAMHAGTLYRALARMVDADWIREVDDVEATSGDERRRYYAITTSGRDAARAEARRLAEKVGAARDLGLLEPA